jgi:hypothetical protein
MTAKRKREPAEAAAGAAERGEDAADIVLPLGVLNYSNTNYISMKR